MPKAYSMDLRQRVINAYDEGRMSVHQLALRFHVKRWWIYKLLRQRGATGSIAPRQWTRGPKPKLAGDWERLRQGVREHPDATLEELRESLGLKVGLTTLWRALAELKLSWKKKS
jgi:transposase